ncbi:MAG: alpha/beta hydrolase [Lachnospiraceae bacterium]|nr:alpha/beta hydrolase [Lachnospiraceae bacterium]
MLEKEKNRENKEPNHELNQEGKKEGAEENNKKETTVSPGGMRALKAVEMLNHMPGIGPKAQSGELRRRFTAMEHHWNVPEGLRHEVLELSNCQMEWLEPEDGEGKKLVVLQLHGGGYYGRLHNTYRNMAALYQKISGGAVASLDYRVAPEHPYPAAFEDAVEAYQYLLAQGYAGDEIFVAGDSAGGGLALALTLYLRDELLPLPAAVITMSAWTDLTLSGDSYTENFNTDPMFGGSTDTLVYHNAYPGEHDPREPYISPLFGDFTGFPPMLMQVGEREMLLSDTLEVARKAKICGVRVKEQIFPGMFHVFQMGLTRYPEAEQAWKQVRKFIRGIAYMDAAGNEKTE